MKARTRARSSRVSSVGRRSVIVTALASHFDALGFYMGYAPPGTSPLEPIALAQEAERLGYDSAWAAEAWGTDCVTVLSWLGATTEKIKLGSAIMQIPGRTPANTAMTAATLDLLSGGRFLLGLGTSGPQVVEGWHGEAWGKPLTKTREYVEIVRAALRRELVEHHGEHYDIPLSNGTGLGKPLKLMARPLRADVPIYLAAMGPKAVAQAFEIGDGWLPLFWSPERARGVWGRRDGRRARRVRHRGDRARDPHRRRRGRARVPQAVLRALHRRDGRAREELLQRPLRALRLRGGGAGDPGAVPRRVEARCRRRLPDAFVDEVALVGPKERLAERVEAWRESGATSLLVSTQQPEALRALAEIAL